MYNFANEEVNVDGSTTPYQGMAQCRLAQLWFHNDSSNIFVVN